MQLSTPYVHKSNGLCERAIGTLIGRLRRLVYEGRGSWIRHIQEAVEAMNTSYHKAVGTAPRNIMMHQTPQGEEISPQEVSQLIIKARRIQKEQFEKMKMRCQRRLRGQPIQEGMKVWRYKNDRRGKFSPYWDGPHVVECKQTPHLWNVRLNDGRLAPYVHSDQLKVYHE